MKAMPKKSLNTVKSAPIPVSIPYDFEGLRVDKALTALLISHEATLSRSRLQALLASECVTLAGKKITDANRKVKAGEVYSVALPAPLAAEPEAQKIKLKIIFEDKDLLVIDKPFGMVVHPAPGNRDRTLVNALLAHCGASLSGIGGVARPGIVHRLDKDTSGLMVVAKNDFTHQALTRQFADRSLSRTYRALVWGTPLLLSGQIEAAIGRHPRERVKMAVTTKGKPALTYYKVLEIFEFASLLECKLATGRTHQIRVHLAHIGHPVIGDKVYGGRKSQTVVEKVKDLKVFSRQALHAIDIEFIHPRSGKGVRFSSSLPRDMTSLLKKLKSKK